jgi:DNA replication protein DnaC
MDVAKILPVTKKNSIINNGDYKDEDGLWHCGLCGMPKQKRIDNELLHTTVWCICRCRAQEILEERKKQEYEEEMRRVDKLKDSSMMADKYRGASFSNYKVRDENKKAFRISQKYVCDFKRMRKEGHPKTGEKNIGLVFYGQVGTGKSYTAACIANALMEQHIPVIMTSFVKILQDIQNKEEEAKYISILNGCSLLIIDDLGAERNTDYALEKVYNVIDSRVRADKPMILTTNLSFDEMMRNPDVRCRRIYDRIFEHCLPVEIPGKSFRIIKAAQRQKKLEEYYSE